MTRNETAWHALDEEALWQKLGSGEQGLQDSEIPHRQAQYGKNTLDAAEPVTVWGILLHQVHNPLIYLLLGASALSLATGHFIDAAVIGAVVVLNTLLGGLQEWKADRAMEALHDMAAPHANVLRDGRVVTVSSENIVPGDILTLETGDRVAADARIIDSSDLHANESALTGESDAVHKRPDILSADQGLGDRHNMAWMSTAITAGRGRAVVVDTGMNTTLGRIAGSVRQTEREQTPLQKRLSKLGTTLGICGVALAGAVFALGLLRGYEWMEMALFSVAVAVSAIPEGLPAVISVTLALGVQRMARRQAIVRRLPAVETLGSTTVICSDKTGTITRNEMTVTHLWTPVAQARVTGAGFEPEGAVRTDAEHDAASPPAPSGPDIDLLLRIGALNNNATLTREDGGAWRMRGSPTEGAILAASRKGGFDMERLKAYGPRAAEVPFGSEHKYMAVLHALESDSDPVVYVKGAPDRIVGFCDRVMIDGKPEPLTDERRATIEAANRAFADQALRVVAGAVKTLPPGADTLTREDAENGLVFVGLWGLVDPPRPEAIQAIADAQGAGIRIVMITGDHAATAAAIARETGIVGHGERVITGQELEAMPDDELDTHVDAIAVYARVSPAHKLRILQALKRRGHVVAMTGDGVNDAPALKGADIGVAMGKTGTEVAKEAADIVLADDDFATMVHAVEEGRTIFANLRRVVFFLLTTNLGEIITLATALMIGLPLPLTAAMILWINLVTDGACTIPLGIEPQHRNVLKQPPRSPRAGVLDRAMLVRILILAPLMAAGTLGLYAFELHAGSAAHAQTVAFTALAAFQWFHALNARSASMSLFSIGLFGNPGLWAGILTAVGLQVLVTQTAAGQYLFGIEPLTLSDWVLISAVAGIILVVDEIFKWLGLYGNKTGPSPKF